MRKLFALIAVLGMLTIGASSMLMAQENETTQTETKIGRASCRERV